MSHRDLIAAVTSGFIGALALAASIYNVYLQRLQVRAQVWPHLSWSTSDSGDDFSYGLENSGVGPAIIKGVRMTVDRQPVTNWDEAWKAQGSIDPAMDALVKSDQKATHSTICGLVVAAGANMHPFKFEDVSEETRSVLRRADKRLKIQICYCSTLDDCWMTEGFTSKPIAVCPMDLLTFED